VAFNNAQDCKMSDLGMCVAGNGSSTGTSSVQKRLRADLAGGSGTNIRLWDSFKPGARDITFSPTGNNFTLSSNTSITATMNYSSSGTYWSSRVLGNSSWLYSKWQANKTSGNDTATYGTRTSTTFQWTHNLGSPANTDFWEIVQVIPSSSAFERFFCNTTGGNEIENESITVYDTGGGGL